MQYIYAALLLHENKQAVSEDNVKKVLHAAGAKTDDGKVKALIASLEGVNIDEAVKMAAVAPAAAPAAHGGAAKAAEVKDEKTEEKKEEEAAAGLASLFG